MKHRFTLLFSLIIILAILWPIGFSTSRAAPDQTEKIYLPNLTKAPPNPTTYTFAASGEPQTLDPAMDYESAGIRVIFNLYDTLIFYNRDDPNSFVPQLATDVPSLANGGISSDGMTYTFHLRSGVKFHDGSSLTVEDVAYSIRRGILQGGSVSPQWMLTEPLLGIGIYDVAELVDPILIDDPAGLQAADPAKLTAACQQVMNAITVNAGAGTVTFHLAQPYAPFLSILSGTWGSVRAKAWTIASGGWDGNCNSWQYYYGKSVEELNDTPLGASAMGSGPYQLDHWTPGVEIVLKANPNYWRTSPAWPGGPTGAAEIKTVQIKTVSDINTRLSMLQSGEADGADTGGMQTSELDALVGEICDVDGACFPSSDPGQPLRLTQGFEVAQRMDMFPVWQINSDSNDQIGSGVLDGNGIPPNFFSDLHVRKAFAYCFNYPSYQNQIFNGGGSRSIDVMLPGMSGYEDAGAHYEYDPLQCEAEFKASTLTSPGGASLWDTGFYFKFAYNEGNTARQVIAEMYQLELAQINPKFQVVPVEYIWSDYNTLLRNGKLPIFHSGWIEDYHDTHAWVQPYTVGTFGSRQKLPQTLKDQFSSIISQGVSESDPTLRAGIYHEFNQLYYNEAVSVLLFLSPGKDYQQRWISGWYPNQVFAGYYYYSLAKR